MVTDGAVADAVVDAVEDVVTDATVTDAVVDVVEDAVANTGTETAADSFTERLNKYILSKSNIKGEGVFKSATTSVLKESISDDENSTLADKTQKVLKSTITSTAPGKVINGIVKTLTPEQKEADLKADILLANSLKKWLRENQTKANKEKEKKEEELKTNVKLDEFVDLIGPPKDFLRVQKSK